MKNKANNKVEDSKRKYCKLKFTDNADNTKGTWRIIDDVLNPAKSTKQSNAEHLDINGSIVIDSYLICEHLDNHFSMTW